MTSNGSYFPTYSGCRVDVLHPDPSQIKFRDIAHALSQICRYAGHTVRMYSVAEHCVRLVQSVSLEAKRMALIHDASEAYLQDVPRPIKRLEVMKPYLCAEIKLSDVIFEKYRVLPSGILSDSVVVAVEGLRVMDLAMPLAECHLAGLYLHPWNLPPMHGENESDAMKVAQVIFDASKVRFGDRWGWHPEHAERVFTMVGRELGIDVDD